MKIRDLLDRNDLKDVSIKPQVIKLTEIHGQSIDFYVNDDTLIDCHINGYGDKKWRISSKTKAFFIKENLEEVIKRITPIRRVSNVH